ncbi:DNRLRE domain-containing protein [Streptomyces xinghaiensis]|uniref:DNRLRE domain-containing protein n=1 Tax=Streptomyces xinghaiensis TaxID=1038928 RepID=UPI002E0D9EBC|nr:DNRLRE domain-containing protein [Streptomyces xinghaiensis]
MLLAAEAAVTVAATGQAVALSSQVPAAEATTDLGPAQAGDEASAMLMARLQDRRIEVLDARTEDTTSWANPDGTVTVESFTGPVRVKDSQGKWQPVDVTLAETGGAVVPKAAAAEIALSAGGSSEPLAQVTRGEKTFGVSWDGTLPKPVLKGNTATYPNAVPGGDVVVSALPEGFSHLVVLRERPSRPVEFRLPVKAKGLTLTETTDKRLRWEDTKGKEIAAAPPPTMWDASEDAKSQEPKHTATVSAAVESTADGEQTLVLKPSATFLSDPGVTYPVVVDPTNTLAGPTTDTWIQYDDYPTSQRGSTELKAGTYDGVQKARSFLKFNTSQYAGKKIVDTDLRLYSYYSSTCSTTGSGVQVRRITTDWDPSAISWSAQPSTTTTGAETSTAAKGYNSTCPAGHVNWDVDAIVQAWADGQPNYGIRMAAVDETDVLTWRRYRSANYVSGSHNPDYEPSLTVTYNSYPAKPTSAAISPSAVNAYNGVRYVTSLTPQLSAKVTDADGGTVKAEFEITPDPAYNDTTYNYTGITTAVASGSTATLTVPSTSTLPAGKTLRYRVRVYDGSLYGSWTSYANFRLNTVKPTAPAITCAPYSQDTWTAKAADGAQCTFDTTSTDGQGYYWGLNDPNAPNRIDDTSNGTGGDPLTVTVKPGGGWHTLYAKTIDSGGNLSTTTTEYKFGVGADGAAILTPGDGDRPARRVALSATGKTTYTGVTFEYRRGETDSWQNVPLADVTHNSDGSPVTAWPLAAPNGAPPALTWNITTTFADDGPIDVRAAFTDGTTIGYSQPVTVTVDREAGDAPAEGVGPGEVNMLTGDFSLTEADASAFGLSATRSTSSRRATANEDMEGQAPIFGPDWISGITADVSGSDWASIRKTSETSAELLDSSGNGVGFTATSTGGWKPEPGSEHLTLTGSLTGSFTVKDTSGTTTTFAKVDPAATTWQAATSNRPVSNSTTTVVSEKVVSGSQTLARPKYAIAPTSAASSETCATTPSTKGCRALEFIYASSTTATATAFGDYSGQVKEIRLRSTEPGASAATSKAVQAYAYDDSGRLRQAWNPQITPSLKTEYDYDTAGRVTKLTPPGELPWTFTYGKAGNAATAGEGMLLKASRPGLQQGTADIVEGTAATSIVYDVPMSGTTAPYKMGAADIGTWGQTDVPTDATAVFPADVSPAGHAGSALSAGDYQRAAISYVDASGREVNTASPGGRIATAEYDHVGNAVRELTASNRELALATSGSGLDKLIRLGISDASTAERAQLLSTTHIYSSDGQRELEAFGPLHLTTLTTALKAGTGGTDLPAGTEIAAREHTVTDYDEGRPTDGTAKVSDMPTTVAVGAHVDGYPSDADTRATKTTYDWAKGLQLSTVEDAGGLNITKATSYDGQGRMIKTTLPKSNGTDAGATVTTYWSASGSGACNGRPEWADLVCSTGPAGAITDGGTNPAELPTKTAEYDWWGQPAKVIEAANGVIRTTTMTTDDAGRVTKAAMTGGVGTAVPDATTTYDANTGRVATTSANAQTITTAFDKLGRQVSYNDGAGNTTTTEYDLLDRPVKATDSAPSTTTYTYDTTKDPRGLPTSLTDSVAGTFTASYDADGKPVTEHLPGGYTSSIEYDEAGGDTSRTYTRDTDSAVILADIVDYSIHGQIVHHTGTAGDTTEQEYTYDKLGRLTRTDDTAADGSCTRRAYSFDNNTNRVSLATSVSEPSVACTDTGSTTSTSTYDSADRLIATGITYDAFGRTTTQSNGTAIDYYANDMVRRQTTGSQRETWGLDAAGRLASWTTESQNTDGTWSQTGDRTNHYGSDSDSPSWMADNTAGTIVRSVRGVNGDLQATTTATGDVALQLTNIHGDVAVQFPLDTAKSPTVFRQDEYGNPVVGSATTRYGWLGGKQRSSETLTGAILMGVRLYDPALGRFLQVDPIPGGNANAYDYTVADPVNKVDLDGKWHKWRTLYRYFGKVKWHSWRFWKRGWGWDHGLHAGVSVRIYFNRWATRWMASEGPYVLGFVAAVLTALGAGPVAWLLTAYAAWIVWQAYRANKRGKCLKVFATAKRIQYWPIAYTRTSYVRC